MRIRRGVLEILLLLLAGLVAAAHGVEPGLGPAAVSIELAPGATPAELAAARVEVLAAVNAARTRAGSRPLVRHAALERGAERHAHDLVAHGYFAHDSPEGSTPRTRARDAGYARAAVVGETLAYGQRTAGEVVAAWLGSPPHRRILLDARLVEAGVGVALARQGRSVKVVWVGLFGAPSPS